MNDANPTHLNEISAVNLAKLIGERKVSSREVIDAHLDRIEELQPTLNAVAIDLHVTARQAADAADAKVARGEALGPLHGVPVSIKGQFIIDGTETTLGLPSQQGRADGPEGPLIANLRRAGAIFVAKTNIMQTLMGYETDNALYGRCNNPWDTSRTPGGSSGGEAALIAAKGSPLGLGGDLAGSVRIPAHFCGIAGFAPTARRLPLDDTPTRFFPLGQESIVPQPGPLARDVDDLICMMNIFAQPFARPPANKVPPVPWRDPGDIDIKNLKVGVFEDNGMIAVSPAITRALREASQHLQDAGIAVVPFTPPDPLAAAGVFLDIILADGGAGVKALVGGDKLNPIVQPIQRMAILPRPLRPLISAVLSRLGMKFPAQLIHHGGARNVATYWNCVAARMAYANQYIDGMAAAGLDAVLCPPYATPAPGHGKTIDLLPASVYCLMTSVSGMCAGVVPATRVRADETIRAGPFASQEEKVAAAVDAGSAGLPVGVQIAAPPWQDATALALMRVLQSGFAAEVAQWSIPGPEVSLAKLKPMS